MVTVTVQEAKATLADLLRRAEAGEEIVIADSDRPVAVLRGYIIQDIARRRESAFGLMVGKYPANGADASLGALPDDEIAAWAQG